MTSAATRLAHCRAILLDMDGTLVNSHAAVEAAWKAWARDNGLDPAAVPVEIPSSRATCARVMPGDRRTRAQTSAARAQWS